MWSPSASILDPTRLANKAKEVDRSDLTVSRACRQPFTLAYSAVMASGKRLAIPVERLGNLIHEIRGQKVMLDRDLAAVYGVATRDLNKAVKRNCDRFPEDFAFQLTRQELADLMFQIGTSSFQTPSGPE